MRIRGAIFDVDGTLLDSMGIWDTVGADYLRSTGYEPREGLNEAIHNLSMPQVARYLQQVYGVALGAGEITAGINAMLERFYREEAPLKPGARALLERLRQGGVRMCIATATDRYLVETALSRLGVLGFFSGVFTCSEAGHGKDEPAIFEAALRLLETERAETWVFEDALYALKTAKNAGFPVAAVFDSHEPAQAELRALASFYLEDLSQFEPPDLN